MLQAMFAVNKRYWLILKATYIRMAKFYKFKLGNRLDILPRSSLKMFVK
jgi:hypothetical protein